MSLVRTSENSPLGINELHLEQFGLKGVFGMTICPGKKGPSVRYGHYAWDRNMYRDMRTIAEWGADAVITLLEDYEFAELGLDRMSFNKSVVNNNMEWRHIRIIDGGIPDERFDEIWYDVKRHTIDPILASGGKVLVHCRGGLGRTGTVVAQYIMEQTSHSPEEVVRAIRQVRPGAVENSLQEEYLRGFE